MYKIAEKTDLKKICDSIRPNECITIFDPSKMRYVFEIGLEKFMGRTLDELNSVYVKSQNVYELIPDSDKETVEVLSSALFSSFLQHKKAFRPLVDYMYYSYRMYSSNGELLRIEKDIHSYYEQETQNFLFVNKARRLDFKSSNQSIEWGLVIDSEKKNEMILAVKLEIYNCLKIQPLTNREEQIIKLIGTGKPLKDVGSALFIERNTVKKHIENIKKKLSNKFVKEDLNTKDQIFNIYRKYGIVE